MSKFRRNAILNLLFNYSNIMFSVVTGIFLVPFYLRHLSLETYGSFIVASGVAALIGLLEGGLSMVTTQQLARSYAESDTGAFRRTAFAGLIAACLLFLGTCVVTLGMATQIGWLSQITTASSSDLVAAFVMLGIAAAFNIHLNLFGSVFQAMLRSGVLGTVNLLAALVGIGIVIATFSSYPSLTAIAAGTLARMVCAALLLMGTAHRALRVADLLPVVTPFSEVLSILRACGPIFTGSIAKSLAENAQNLLLTHAASPAALAVLALTQKALQMCSLVLAPIGSSIFSNLTHLKHGTTTRYFSSLLGIAVRGHFLLSVVLIAVASTLNQSFVSIWVGPEKFGGEGLSILLGIATLLVTRFSFTSVLIYSFGDFKKPLTLEICYSAAKILLLFLTIDSLHLYAIPLADITAALFFLFHMSIRTLAPHLREGLFGDGLYYRGWPELALITALGLGFAAVVPVPNGWWSLGLVGTLFFLLASACALALNTTFVREVAVFQRLHRTTPA